MVEGFLRLNADFLAGRLTHETVNADSEKVVLYFVIKSMGESAAIFPQV